MQSFAALLERLVLTPSRNAKLQLIIDYLHHTPDPSRGWVIEEALILLPRAVRVVLLSATIPNGAALAGWLAMLRQTPCERVLLAAAGLHLDEILWSDLVL